MQGADSVVGEGDGDCHGVQQDGDHVQVCVGAVHGDVVANAARGAEGLCNGRQLEEQEEEEAVQTSPV